MLEWSTVRLTERFTRVTRLASHHLLRLASIISFRPQTSAGVPLEPRYVEASFVLRATEGCSAAQQRGL